MPLLEPLAEVLRDDVSGNTCESYGALSPRIEAEVELVVLDPPNAANVFLAAVSFP
jgi:hypothetical protein